MTVGIIDTAQGPIVFDVCEWSNYVEGTVLDMSDLMWCSNPATTVDAQGRRVCEAHK